MKGDKAYFNIENKTFSTEGIELQETPLWLMENNKAIFKSKTGGGKGTNQYQVKGSGKTKLQGNKPISCQWVTLKDGRKICIGDNGKFYIPKINVGTESGSQNQVDNTIMDFSVGGANQNDDFREYIKSYKSEVDLTSDEMNSVGRYTENDFYQSLNKALRNGEKLDVTKASAISNIDTSIQKQVLRNDIYTYRGGIFDANLTKNWKAGSVIEDKAFISTSLERDIAKEFINTRDAKVLGSDATLFKIKVPKGSNGLFVDLAQTNIFEGELLLPRGSKFKINSMVAKELKPLPGYSSGGRSVTIEMELLK